MTVWKGDRLKRLKLLLKQLPRLTYEEIGREFGCSRGAISGAVTRHIYEKVP